MRYLVRVLRYARNTPSKSTAVINFDEGVVFVDACSFIYAQLRQFPPVGRSLVTLWPIVMCAFIITPFNANNVDINILYM